MPALPAPGERTALDRTPAHHLLDVLRIRRGERVRIFDGSGLEADALLVEVTDGVPWLEVVGPARSACPPHPLHVLLAIAKGPAMDAAIRMVTEAGATHLHPILTARSVPKGDRADRWERIAASAAQQCGRADVPTLAALDRLDGALAQLPAGLDARVAVPGAAPLAAAEGPAAVLIGPEGGLTTEEVDRALAAGFRAMGLGRFVLRAETAAAVAVAMTAPN